MNFLPTKFLTFSIIKYLGFFASIIFWHSQSKDDEVPEPFSNPSCLPANEIAWHGKLYVNKSQSGTSSGLSPTIDPRLFTFLNAL